MGQAAHHDNGYTKAQIKVGGVDKFSCCSCFSHSLHVSFTTWIINQKLKKNSFLSSLGSNFEFRFAFFLVPQILWNPENNGCRFLLLVVRERWALEAGRKLIKGNKDGGGTEAVASGIFQINTAVSNFQRLVNTLGTPKDTPELRHKLWVSSVE